ncbi:hypothetical protein V6N11_012573 [Hibiscus sabdariffa]|uniref:RNase H type-1 domain-containing protein n=2 Tax=Hibiscus sabdariffa TaxID=183260 RepID=A0ABR2QBY6_9ROSI
MESRLGTLVGCIAFVQYAYRADVTVVGGGSLLTRCCFSFSPSTPAPLRIIELSSFYFGFLLLFYRECRTLVEKVWTSDSGHLISKLSKVGMELRKWSKYHKAKSKKYYESLKARLEELVDDDPDDEKLAELLDVEIALNMEAEKEELSLSSIRSCLDNFTSSGGSGSDIKGKHPRKRLVAESPPVSESLKFNFDASFNSFEKRSTSSIIIRDSSGQPMAASTFPQLFTRDPEMTEAKACEQAVLLARDLGFRKVIIEGDALNVINKLNNHVEDRPDIGAIVKNIQDVRKQFQNISFVHVSRRCNRVAHTLVKDYGTSTTQMVWIEEVPIYVEEAAEDDRWWVRPLDY